MLTNASKKKVCVGLHVGLRDHADAENEQEAHGHDDPVEMLVKPIFISYLQSTPQLSHVILRITSPEIQTDQIRCKPSRKWFGVYALVAMVTLAAFSEGDVAVTRM
jgi:hypothetical protein